MTKHKRSTGAATYLPRLYSFDYQKQDQQYQYDPATLPTNSASQAPQEKIHKLLKNMLDSEDLQRREDVLITYDLSATTSHGLNELGSDVSHQAALERAAYLSQFLNSSSQNSHEQQEYQQLYTLLNQSQIEVKRHFHKWCILLVSIPLSALKSLLEQDNGAIRYVELRFANERLGSSASDGNINSRYATEQPGPTLLGSADNSGGINNDTDSINTVDDSGGIKIGIDVINSDLYRQAGLNGGRIALLDTGIIPSLDGDQLKRVEHRYQCVHEGPDHCVVDDSPWCCEDCESGRHGALVAITLTGKGHDYSGITKIPVDSYNVYQSNDQGVCQLDVAAVLSAFHCILHAPENYYTVVVAMIQGNRDIGSSIVLAAEQLYDERGLCVIAPVGNHMPNQPASGDSTQIVYADEVVLVPSCSPKVIGVGAVEASSPGQWNQFQRYGGATNRIKPDVLGPTDYWVLRDHNGGLGDTSGATPFVAAAAALLHNLIAHARKSNLQPLAGYVYALLIAAGRQRELYSEYGAGLIRLPGTGDTIWLGQVSLDSDSGSSTMSRELFFQVPEGANGHLDIAVWWPDNPYDHHMVRFDIYSPDGKPTRGIDQHSAFQIGHVNGPLVAGRWKLHIYGTWPQKPGTSQQVYCVAILDRYEHKHQLSPISSITLNSPANLTAPFWYDATDQGRSARDTVVLRGYIGWTPTLLGGHPSIRLYFDTNKTHYIEILEKEITHIEKINEFTELCYVWTKAAALQKHNSKMALEPLVALRGYLGQSIHHTHFRLYFDAQLAHYLDIPNSNFRYADNIPMDSEPLSPTYIWIDADAEVEEGWINASRKYKAGLLEGIVTRDYLSIVEEVLPEEHDFNGWNQYAPTMGLGADCPPSSSCATHGGGYCAG